MTISPDELKAIEDEVKSLYRKGFEEEEPIGFFMETGIYSQGIEQPPRRTAITHILTVCDFDELKPTDQVVVLSSEGNEYTLTKDKIVLF